MRDDESTYPSRVPVEIRNARDVDATVSMRAPASVRFCPICLHRLETHSEFCVQVADRLTIARHYTARAHFVNMTQLDRLLALGMGARKRGAWFHYKGAVLT